MGICWFSVIEELTKIKFRKVKFQIEKQDFKPAWNEFDYFMKRQKQSSHCIYVSDGQKHLFTALGAFNNVSAEIQQK